jgi:hypothetical protein
MNVVGENGLNMGILINMVLVGGMMFLGNWKKMYRKNRTFKNDAEQQQFLDAKIKKIFKNDYPQDFINSL